MIFLIILLGFILRLISLNQSFWLDEATSAIVVRDLRFSEIISQFSVSDFHPPLYYLFLKTWTMFSGYSEVGIRSFSVFVGIITIYIIYLIGKDIFSKKVGTLTALLLATSNLHIYYSQEARMYSLVTLFTVLAFYFFTKVEEGRSKYWFLFSLTIAAIFLTDYLPVTILVCFWIYGLLFHKKFIWWKGFIFSQVPLFLAGLFWLPTFLKQIGGGLSIKDSNWWNILGRTTFKEIVLIPAKFIIGRVSIENKLLYPLLLLGLFVVFGFLIFTAIKKFDKKEGKLVVLWLTVPAVLAILIGIKVPVLSYFRLLFILPAFYLVIAYGILKLGDKLKPLILVLVLGINLATSSVYLLNPKFHREDWRSLVRYIESNRSSDSAVLFVANSQMEAYKYYAPNAKVGGPASFDKDTSEVWLIRYVKDLFDPEDTLLEIVQGLGFESAGGYNFNGIEVLKYENKQSLAK